MLVSTSIFTVKAQEYTRGIGVYPGNVKEDFSPVMKIDTANYRNLALHRPAYQSSSYDYNLTAQLTTDGMKESQLPGWIVTTTSSDGIVKKNEREWVLDRNTMTRKNFEGPLAWLQIEMAGTSIKPVIDSINVSGSLLVDSLQAKHWELTVEGSDNGINWKKLGLVNGNELPGDTITGFWRKFSPQNLRVFNFPFKLDTPAQLRFYRLDVNSPNAISWSVNEFALFNGGKHADIGGPYHFTSAWMSASSKEEWIYVDLGSECSFDRIILYWIRRAAIGSIQVSNNAVDWKDIAPLSDTSGQIDDIKFEKPFKERYVRIFMIRPVSADGYILSELEVFGTGGPVAIAHPQPAIGKNDRLELAGGDWRLQRESLVKTDGKFLSEPGYNDNDWITATVPATVLVSYLNACALPDPNFGDNQLLISDSYFYSNFWYRNEFIAPAFNKDKRMFLNFDGINWKAEVFLNGQKLGLIEGAFTRAHFDVTDILVPGTKNVLAVLIRKNDAPGFVKEQTKFSHDANGGELGADNPTFHASVGWDWIPTIRGRNIGIWNKVYISESGPVTIEDPFVSVDLPLPETTTADVNIELTLHNFISKNVQGILRGKFGKNSFGLSVTMGPLEIKTFRFTPKSNSSLRMKNPRLWWPNGYGKQSLYNVELEFITADGYRSDSKSFQTGIREMSYSEDNGILKIWINGKRFIGKGGNWGFSESMLRYRARDTTLLYAITKI